jgi:hypothetical protein
MPDFRSYVHDGQPVNAGATLGHIGTDTQCGAWADRAHVHFFVKYIAGGYAAYQAAHQDIFATTYDVSLSGQSLGGWRVSGNLGGACMTRGSAVACEPNGVVTNDSQDSTLGFIKTLNTGGTVEVHTASLVGGSYKSVLHAPSDFGAQDRANGTWQLFGSSNGAPQLGFIKTLNTGGTVEVHTASLVGGSYKSVLHAPSDFGAQDRANGTWQLFGSSNGAPQLGFIKLYATPSGKVEVHIDSWNGSSYQRVGSYPTDFSAGDATNGTWVLFGSANGAPELAFIKQINTAGTVEVHIAALSGGTYRRVSDSVSDFGLSDAYNGTWQVGTR